MRITANQVTVGRMLALPVPCALLLWAPLPWQYVALLLFTIIGLLDLVDGIMARKQGPTQFGAMLDPLADKVFVACAIVPFAAQGRAPIWIPALLLAREFLVTGLRSATALRQSHIKTSVLAKLKTSIQMAGFGLVFLNMAVPGRRNTLWVLGIIAAGAVLFFVGRWIQQRKFPSVFFWVPCGLIVLAFVLRLFVMKRDTTLAYLLVILVFTWGSGIDYLIGSARILLKDGLKWLDFARLYWTASSVLVAVVAAADTRLAFLVIIALSAEFLVGGVDNLRALSGSPTSTRLYIIRCSLTSVLAGFLIAAPDLDLPDLPRWIAVTALAGLSVGYAVNDLVRARALIDSRAANAAYSTDPPPRTASA